MKLRAFALMVVAASLAGIAAAQAQAPGRTQVENLFYNDPTQAKPGQWAIGVNAEAWGVILPGYKSSTVINGSSAGGSTTTTGWEAGGSGFIGYDNFLLQVTALGGKFTSSSNFAGGLQQNVSANVTQVEVFGRYILPTQQFWGITPAIVAGYDYTAANATFTDSAGFVFTNTGTSTLRVNSTYNTLFAGVGGLMPFGNTNAGMRFDVEGGPAFGESKYTNFTPGIVNDYKGTGLALMGHITGYWNFAPEWTGQLGLKAAGIANQANGVQSWGAVGAFVSLGYDHRF